MIMHIISFCRLKLVFKRLNTQLNESTNQNSLLSPKLLSKQTNTSSDIQSMCKLFTKYIFLELDYRNASLQHCNRNEYYKNQMNRIIISHKNLLLKRFKHVLNGCMGILAMILELLRFLNLKTGITIPSLKLKEQI